MLHYSADQIESSLSLSDIIATLRNCFLDLKKEKYDVPQRMHIEKERLTVLVMPAFGGKYFSTKLVAVAPANPALGLPLISGTLVLNDAATGEALAQFDAPVITALRTGAVGALGLELLSRPEQNHIGIIGCGVQGIWQTIFAAACRPVQKVYCYSRTASAFEKYQKIVKQYHPSLQLVWCEAADELVAQSTVIYTCTSANTPVFSNDENLVKNRKFIAVGSFRKDMQELPAVVFQQTNKVVVDTTTASVETGDLINPLRDKLIRPENIYLMQDVIEQAAVFQTNESVVFKSVGMAAFDLALAIAIYESDGSTSKMMKA